MINMHFFRGFTSKFEVFTVPLMFGFNLSANQYC